MIDEANRTFSTDEVAAATGVSFRMIHYWVRCGYVAGQRSSGSGVPLTWTAEQVSIIRTMKALRDCGCPLAKIEPILTAARYSPDRVVVAAGSDVRVVDRDEVLDVLDILGAGFVVPGLRAET